MAAINKRHNPDDVFNFIVCYKRENDGLSPTYREIMDSCGVSSLSVIKFLLDKLVEAERIELPQGKQSGIKVIGGQWTYQE